MTVTNHDPLNVGRRPEWTELVFAVVDSETFALHFNGARHHTRIAEATSEFEHEEGTLYVLTTDALSGFAVREDGELVYVWSVERGRGNALVSSAVRVGATYLDCFDGYLPSLYERHGFRRVKTVPNWTVGGPDVVYMALRGYASRHGEEG